MQVQQVSFGARNKKLYTNRCNRNHITSTTKARLHQEAINHRIDKFERHNRPKRVALGLASTLCTLATVAATVFAATQPATASQTVMPDTRLEEQNQENNSFSDGNRFVIQDSSGQELEFEVGSQAQSQTEEIPEEPNNFIVVSRDDVLDSQQESQVETSEQENPIMETRPDFEINLSFEQEYAVEKFLENWEENQDRYYHMEEQTGVPAQLIAAIHWRESGANFNTYLHNGATLGSPIYTVLGERLYSSWEESALDALTNFAYPKYIDKNDIQTYYDFAERYNGMGYSVYHDMESPYVWAGTDRYTCGKYVADGTFDPNAVDRQVGVAVLLDTLFS